MEARNFSLAMLLKCNAYYEIPYFQRPFVWNEDNWSEFLNSLSDSNKTHFLGSIVLKPAQTNSGYTPHYSVIDGQQRLTTFSLLVRACYDALNERKPSDLYKYTEMILIEESEDVKRPKIQHSYFDCDVYEKVILDKELTEEDKKSLIYKCYKYFLDECEKLGDEKNRKFFNEVLANTNLQMVVKVDLKEKDNEQEIFDVINSTGVKLTSADIIKNSIFQKANDLLLGNSHAKSIVETLYKDDWHEIFYGDKELEDFWCDEITVRSIKRSNVEMFLYAIACIKGIYDPEKHRISELSECFKQEISKYQNIAELKRFLEDIKGYASYYKELFEFDKNELYSYNDGLRRLLHIINTTRTTTFRSYILKLIHAEGTTVYADLSQETKDELYDLEVLLIRGVITNSNVSKNYNKFTRELLLGVYSVSHLLEGDYGIDNDSMRKALTNVTNSNATLLLFWIELYRRREESTDINELKYNFTLEHVMPKKWKEKWSDVSVYKDSVNKEEHSDYKVQVRDRAILQLGNMTLLKSKLNKSIQNNAFSEKVKGIKRHSELKISKEIFAKSTWDERNIYARTSSLADEIFEIWKMPDTANNFQASILQDELNLYEGDNGGSHSLMEITTPKEAKDFLKNVSGIAIVGNVTYATRNDEDIFWMTPKKDFLDSDWSLILNDRINRRLILITVPAGTFKVGNVPGKEIKVRSDKPNNLRVRLRVATLEDSISGCNFASYVTSCIDY